MSDFKSEDHHLTSPLDPPRGYESEHLVPPQRSNAGVVSFLSSHERDGHWEVPRRFRALAVMGNVELDLRAAEIGYGVSVIEVVAVLGNIELTIPPEITIECDGDSLLGTFTVKYEGRTSPSQASRDRVIRVTGTAYVGAVTVKVKGPDEPLLKRIGRTLGMEQQ
jgi:Cell wall-active antibiotics response 4TMS YvqF